MSEDDNKSSPSDLTRIEDLGEYIHPDDEESEEGDSPSISEENGEDVAEEESFEDAIDGEPGIVEEPVEEQLETAEGEAELVADEAIEEGDALTAEGEVWDEDPETFQGETALEEESAEEEAVREEVIAEEPAEEEAVREEVVAEEPVEEEAVREEVVEEEPVQERENFEEIRQFADAITYGDVAARGTPPFTVIVNNIVYREDAEAISAILWDHNICNDENCKDYEQGLEQGAIIIPRISEYSAIYLAHKLRRFDVDIQMGLSDEIRATDSYEREERGLISKYNYRQNVREEVSLERNLMELENVMESTSSTIPGYYVQEQMGMVIAHAVMEEEQFCQQSEGDCRQLLNELKYQACQRNANAVVDVHYQTTTINRATREGEVHLYKVTGTGNAVVVEKE